MARPKGPHAEDDAARKAESARILKGVERDSESIGASSTRRVAERTRDHFMAKDADSTDPAEVWGRRVGRGLSLLFLFGLMYDLAVTYL